MISGTEDAEPVGAWAETETLGQVVNAEKLAVIRRTKPDSASRSDTDSCAAG